MTSPLNSHGDILIGNGMKGSDIASQRLDDLDRSCIHFVTELSKIGKVVVVEYGAGRCGLANTLAEASTNIDMTAVDTENLSVYAKRSVKYIVSDMVAVAERFAQIGTECVDVAISQRTIHYLHPETAKSFLSLVHRSMTKGGRLFLSCSGIDSELSKQTDQKDTPIQSRYSQLSKVMQAKHGIYPPVCLYSLDEIVKAIEDAAFRIVSATTSEFGNHKVIGEKV